MSAWPTLPICMLRSIVVIGSSVKKKYLHEHPPRFPDCLFTLFGNKRKRASCCKLRAVVLGILAIQGMDNLFERLLTLDWLSPDGRRASCAKRRKTRRRRKHTGGQRPWRGIHPTKRKTPHAYSHRFCLSPRCDR